MLCSNGSCAGRGPWAPARSGLDEADLVTSRSRQPCSACMRHGSPARRPGADRRLARQRSRCQRRQATKLKSAGTTNPEGRDTARLVQSVPSEPPPDREERTAVGAICGRAGCCSAPLEFQMPAWHRPPNALMSRGSSGGCLAPSAPPATMALMRETAPGRREFVSEGMERAKIGRRMTVWFPLRPL